MDLSEFKQFIARSKRALSRIAHKTHREYALADIENEAWITAHDIQQKRQIPINFADPTFQDLVLKFLYQKLVRYTDTKIRTALQWDHAPNGYDDEDNSHPLKDKLTTGDGHNPLTILIDEEAALASRAEEVRLVSQQHGSLAHAYTLLLGTFDNNIKALAAYLLLSPSQCRKRYQAALHLAHYQLHLQLHVKRKKTTSLFRPWRKYKIPTEPRMATHRGDYSQLALLNN